MGNRIVYCEVCGDRIVEADLASGKAIIVSGRDYCFKCRDKAPKGIPPSEAIIPAATGHRAVDSTRRLAAHVRAGASSHHGTAPPAKNNTLVVGVVIGGIIALLIVFAMNSGSGPDPSPSRSSTTPVKSAPPDRSAEEAAAYKRIKEYVQDHPDDSDAIIARIEAERERLRKTSYWDNVELYLTQAKERKERKEREKRLADALAKATSIENSDPKYDQRPKVQAIFAEAHSAAGMIGDEAKARVDEAEKGYERRFLEAARSALLPVMQKASQLMKENKFDEALLALDEFPASFAGTPAADNIQKAREQVEARKLAAEQPSPSPTPSQAPAPEWINDYTRACTSIKTDPSEATWKEAAATFEKTIANIDNPELAGAMNPLARFQPRCTAHYFLAIYLCQFKQDMEKTISHLSEALRFGVGKESVEFIEKQPQLANLRKDSRYKAFIEKYTKKYVDVDRRWLAVTGVALFPKEFERLGMTPDEGGFCVAGMIPEMTGAKIGLQPGDVIISFAGEKLPRTGAYAKLDDLLEKTKAGSDYPIVVRRASNGERATLTVRW